MSFSALGTTESADSTANNGENDDFTPLPITGRYKSLQALHRLVKDAIGAHPHITMNDSDVVAVKWADAIEARLYTDDGCLGEIQGDAPYTTSKYEDTFGDTVGTPQGDLTRDERSELKELFRDSENHDVEDVKGKFKLPRVNDERLPVLVADEDVLEDGIESLDAIMSEFDNDAGSTPSDVGSDTEFPVLEGTLDDLEAHLASSTPDEETLREMMDAEKDGKDRKGGRSLIEAAIEERGTTDDDEDEEDDETDDDEAGSTTSGMTDEEKEELATTVATAVVEALDN